MAEIFDFNPVDASNTGRWPENMSPPQINDAGRADEGILARWYQDMDGSRTASGSSNAFSVTSSRTISALFDNLQIVFTANHSISGAATLNLNGLGAKSIRKLNGMNVITGDIVSGQPVQVIYKQSVDRWLMMTTPATVANPTLQVTEQSSTPSTPSSGEAVFYADNSGRARFINDAGGAFFLRPQRLHVQNVLAEGTDGASVSTSFGTRVLNTTVVNEISGASLGSNRATLPAGTYRAMGSFIVSDNGASSNGSVNGRLHNVTDDSEIAKFVGGGRVGFVPGFFTINHVFTLTAQKNIAVQNRVTTGIIALEGRNSGISGAGDMVVTDLVIELLSQ